MQNPAVRAGSEQRQSVEKVDREVCRQMQGDRMDEKIDVYKRQDIDRAIRSRVIFNWASKEGLADEFSYETFQKSLKTENKERKEIKQKGEPLYGPVEFTPMQYYKRQLGEYERRLKDHMMNCLLYTSRCV